MNFFSILPCFSDTATTDETLKSTTMSTANSTPTTNPATEKSLTETTISNQLAVSHYNLGCTKQEEGKLDEAIICYRNAIEEDNNFCDAHYNLANGK